MSVTCSSHRYRAALASFANKLNLRGIVYGIAQFMTRSEEGIIVFLEKHLYFSEEIRRHRQSLLRWSFPPTDPYRQRILADFLLVEIRDTHDVQVNILAVNSKWSGVTPLLMLY